MSSIQPAERLSSAPKDILEFGSVSLQLLPLDQEVASMAHQEEYRCVEAAISGRSNIDLVMTSFVDWWELPERASWWHEGEECIRDILLERLNGQIVVDLGNGRDDIKFQKQIKKFQPKAYVGVDIHNSYGYRPYQEIVDLGIVMSLGDQEGDVLPGALIRSSMLRLVSRLPDNSVSFALNGIDSYIFNPDTAYARRLLQEMHRALSPSGLIFGVTLGGGLLHDIHADEAYDSTYLSKISGINDGQGFFFAVKKGNT